MHLPVAIDRIRPSIVQMQVHGPGHEPTGSTIGTGFIVNEARNVITALHVVDAVDRDAGETLHVGFAGPDVDSPEIQIRANFVATEGYVVDTWPEADLALLEIPGAGSLTFRIQVGDRIIETAPQAVAIDESKVREGTAVAVSGYPLNAPSLVTNAGVLATTFAFDGEPPNMQERHLGDFTANPGNSGGRVYVVAGAGVIGVCVAGQLTKVIEGEGSHSAGLTVIVPAAQLVEFLERNGIDLSKPVAVKKPHTRKKKR